jgi:Flp pilus assembly protein TadD
MKHVRGLLVLIFAFFIGVVPISHAAQLNGGNIDQGRLLNQQGMVAAQRGDWQEARTAFEAACRVDPFNDQARFNLACIHNNLGIKALERHQWSEARFHLAAARDIQPEDVTVRLNLLSVLVRLQHDNGVRAEAQALARLRPRDPAVLLAIGAALQQIEADEDALTFYDQLLDIHPDHPAAHLAIGRLQYRLGRILHARIHLREAQRLGAADPTLDGLIRQVAIAEEDQESQETLESRNFRLGFPTDFPRDWAQEVLDAFETAREDLEERLGIMPQQRLQIVVQAPERMRQAQSLPTWVGGVYDGTIRLPVANGLTAPSTLVPTIQHEYMHHVLHLVSRGTCPVWLHEGLAQLAEGVAPGLIPPEWPLQDGPARGHLNHLFPTKAREESASVAASRYAVALWATHELLRDIEWPGMARLLVELGRGRSWSEAFRLIHGKESFAGWQERLALGLGLEPPAELSSPLTARAIDE